MKGHGRSSRIQRVTVAVAGVAMAASCLVFFISSASVEHSNRLLLRQNAAQGALVLSPYLSAAQPQVSGLSTIVGKTGVDVAAFDVAAASAAARSDLTAVALLQVTAGGFKVVASTGTLHSAAQPSTDPALASAVDQGQMPYGAVVSAGGTRWLVEVLQPSGLPSGYAIYAESKLDNQPISLSSLPGHPFANIGAAVYAGYERPEDVVFATTRHLPLSGERAVSIVPIDGNNFGPASVVMSSRVGTLSAPGRLLIVMDATTSLAGNATTMMPWVLLIGLLAASVALAVLFEISGRRRLRAVRTAEQLAERNALLDRAIAEQRRSDARFAAMVRSSSDLTTVVSADGRVLYQSPASERLLGRRPDAVVGTHFATLLHPDDTYRWQRAVTEASQHPGTEVTSEWRLRAEDGRHIPVEARMTNLLDEPAVGGVVLNSRDVSERNQLEAELRHQAFHDSLTGLANRALFQDRLEHAATRLARGNGTLGVLFLDLDDFKSVNDARGHGAGDALLRAVAERLDRTVRAADTLARLGGDEFAVLLEATDGTMAVGTAERILETLREPFNIPGGENGIGASIGIVTTSGMVDATELLRDADIAMYAAKSGGKARFQVFHSGLHREVVNRLQLEVDLSHAIENDELAVVYQPIVDLGSGAVIGVEALMRWEHPERGTVMPNDFIPIAEATGLIVPMGRWLLRRAAADVRRLQQQSERFDLRLAVNVSARQLDDPRLTDDVAGALAQSGLAAELLTLEITESVFMTNPARSLAVIERLKNIGIKLSIDDFGTGYSSLAYLQRLPVDELKIDRTFVIDSGRESESSTLVETIVRLAQQLGLETVAEGVETQEQFQRLRRTGCHLAQGFLFARPTGLDRLIEHLVLLPGRAAFGRADEEDALSRPR